MTSSCIFCQIIKGELPGNFVYRDERCTVFLDIHPINPGHVLIVPNKHIERFYDLDEKIAEHLLGVAGKIYRAIRKTTIQCEGANIFLSGGSVAGQEVGHTHLHIAPRFANDGHKPGFSHADPEAAKSEKLRHIAQEIRNSVETKGVET